MTFMAACPGCGQMKAKKRIGGKAYVKHSCPHGVTCLFGEGKNGGLGFNGPPIGGPFHCPTCFKEQRRGK